MKVSIITLPFRKTFLIKPVFDAILAQTHKDIEVIAVLNDPTDGSKDIIAKNYPQVKIVEPGYNLFFAKGVNRGIDESPGDFIQLVNDDLILEPDYVEKMIRVFENKQVASATGKILRFDFGTNKKLNIIDTTGITLSASGRGRDRGQLQIDRGQFDSEIQIFGASGAAAMYRKSALDEVRFCENGKCEYFDEDFVMYWEDVDMAWRLNNAGYKCQYVPEALAYHGRTAGQSEGGYLHVWKFVRHHNKIASWIRKLNYKNHILMYIKNAKFIFHPAFICREMAMFGYVVFLESSTLAVIPQLLRQLPKILRKRKVSLGK